MNIKYTINNNVLVKVDKIIEDKIKLGGMELAFRSLNDPNNSRMYGEIVSLPIHMTDEMASSDEYLFKADLFKDFFKTGDTVYFSHTAVLNKERQISDHEFLIPMRNIWARARNGEIIPTPNRTLFEAYYGEDVEEIEYEGQIRKMKVSESGLVIDADPKPDERIATVTHTGRGTNKNIRRGSLCHRQPHTNLKIEIDGREYFSVENDLITGIFTN